eukprot:5985152-Alexandrium_andersonii.AAC.1
MGDRGFADGAIPSPGLHPRCSRAGRRRERRGKNPSCPGHGRGSGGGGRREPRGGGKWRDQT